MFLFFFIIENFLVYHQPNTRIEFQVFSEKRLLEELFIGTTNVYFWI